MKKPANPRFIFFSGVEETEKEGIIKILMETRPDLPNFKYIKLRAIPKYSDEVDIGTFIKNINIFCEKVKKSVDTAMKQKKHVILSGQPVHKIPGGHVPLLTAERFASLMPDVLVFFKVVPKSLIFKKTDLKKVLLEQDLNWDYIKIYSLITGAPLKVISVEHGNIKEAINETYKLLKSILK